MAPKEPCSGRGLGFLTEGALLSEHNGTFPDMPGARHTQNDSHGGSTRRYVLFALGRLKVSLQFVFLIND